MRGQTNLAWQCCQVAKTSAGLLLYRFEAGGLRVLLVHPGGPFWANRDRGFWSIPKGEVGDEDERRAAAREFAEELGVEPPVHDWIALGTVVQSGGKRVRAWAVQGDLDVTAVESNQFEMEWPPHSGRRQFFPEVDRAGWFTAVEGREMLLPSQVPFLDRLKGELGPRAHPRASATRDSR